MNFEVVSSVNDCKNKDTIYLILNNWDDWLHIQHYLRYDILIKMGLNIKCQA